MKKTPLHQNHLNLGAKMGEFAGYDMPLYYDEGVMAEHLWTRSSAGLFDVSHMGQAMIKGPDGGGAAREFVQKLTPSDYAKTPVGYSKYTVLMNPEGGMVDDTIVTRAEEDGFHFVLNAGCKDKDIAWIKNHLPADLEFTIYDDWALIALQGPKAETVMREALDIDLADMPYMSLRTIGDNEMFVTRLGYTGEDGFELSVKNEEMPALWDKLMAHDAVKPVGLAARDSLRLEMGYPLYGHDIDDTTSPIEANIGWIMGKGGNTTFIGADRVLKEKESGVSRVRVGVNLTGRGVAREGAEIRNALNENEKIGALTSGGHSPSLKESIGQGYIDPSFAENGTEILVNVRGRNIEAVIAPMPFVPASTKSMKAKKAA